MPLVATRGAASAQGFGEFAVTSTPTYIEDVFSCFLYTGTGSSQTITNNIDLSTKGGLTWIKGRSGATGHRFTDTARGVTKSLESNSTATEATESTGLTAFGTTGFTIGADADYNTNAATYVSWTFRKQPKFFDVVTWTGDDSANRQISHSLGSVPGCIMVKRTDAGATWRVWHQNMVSNPANLYQYQLNLNTTNAVNLTYGEVWGTSNNVTDTSFQIGNLAAVNASGGSYVAYVFAHNAGGFGLTGSDNVISCGSFTGNTTVNLGYEPQWVLLKRTDGTSNWFIFDNMRGLPADVANSNTQALFPNVASAESATDSLSINSTGFTGNLGAVNYIYIAIRRGPMKVPTSGTSVFYPNAVAQANSPDSSNVPFPPDLVNTFSRDGVDRFQGNQFNFVDRLRGLGTPNNTYTASGQALTSSSTGAEFSAAAYVQLKADSQNITRGSGWNFASYGNWIYYFFRRAPSFFDEVCYTGDGTYGATNHNLGVIPELTIYKKRSGTAENWGVIYYLSSISYRFGNLNLTDAFTTYTNDPAVAGLFSSTQFCKYHDTSGQTYVAYLFATCAGVSKVGSYTGTGTTKQIDCGFTGGARWVMIRRTDSTGDWYVWDSARGIVAGNDPYLLLNSSAAEVTGTDYIDTYSAGFEISSTAPAAINANGGTFIFLAIA